MTSINASLPVSSYSPLDGLQPTVWMNQSCSFSFLGQVVRVASAGSGRLDNTDAVRAHYPYFFVVDMKNVSSELLGR